MDVFEGKLQKTHFEFGDETDRFGMSRSSSVDRVWGLGAALSILGVNEHDSRSPDIPFLRVAQSLEFKFRDF